MNIIEAMRDPNLFGNWFGSETWAVWRVFLASLFALKMTGEQEAMYGRFTGRVTLPQEPAKEAWVVVGRRGGKSLVAALTATFLACFKDYSELLAPGEVATVMVIAADRRQARVVMRYIAGFLESAPMLASMITKRTQEAIHLNNRVMIEIHTCNFRAIRGYTIAGVVCDEIAYWRTEDSANPDAEILNAIRPGMATIRGGLLLCISSPYARRGALWEVYKNHYGKDGDAVLVWQADTASMNPSVDPQIIADSYRDDEAVAAAEYGGEFRRDIETFVAREAIEAVVVPGRYELPPVSEIRYRAFVDPSGGTADSMTLAVGHREDGRIVLDALRESKPPFSPEQVVREYSSLLDRYRIHAVTGDRYGAIGPESSSATAASGTMCRTSSRPTSTGSFSRR